MAAIYPSWRLREGSCMQNEDDIAPAGALPARVRNTLREARADPRAVLFTVGSIGFLINLWNPISIVGLALLVLATTPWIVQTCQHRPGATITPVEVGRQPGRAERQADGRKAAVGLGEKDCVPHRPAAAAMPRADVSRVPAKAPTVQQSPRLAQAAMVRQGTVPMDVQALDRAQPRRVASTPTTTPGAA